MSGQEQESVSERELAEYFTQEGLLGGPRSVGEALAAADEQAPPNPEPLVPPPPGEQAGPEPAEPPPVVTDEPEQPPVAPEGEPPVEVVAEEQLEPEGEEEQLEPQESDDVAWAKKRYGDDLEKICKGARDQDRHIGRLTAELKEVKELATTWYTAAQQAEAQAVHQQQATMPMSSAEEEWVEQAMVNPLEYARAAAFNGNLQLFNAVLERVAEENAMLAGQIGAQVQYDLRQAADEQMAAQYQQNGQQPSLQDALGAAFQRLGLDLGQVGPTMMAKVEELGQYHPYVLAMMGPDDQQRDLAIQAVFDLVQAGTLTKRKIADDQRAEQIRREGELRREAAGVVTGSPHVQSGPPGGSFFDDLEKELRARGQWGEE